MTDKMEDYMCCLFAEPDPAKAAEQIRWETVAEYGSRCGRNFLYTWDRGERFLVRCRRCGKLLLVQDSEYTAPDYSEESFYRDIYPVKSAAEAEELNRTYDGFALESDFLRRALYIDNGRAFWHESCKAPDGDEPSDPDSPHADGTASGPDTAPADSPAGRE